MLEELNLPLQQHQLPPRHLRHHQVEQVPALHHLHILIVHRAYIVPFTLINRHKGLILPAEILALVVHPIAVRQVKQF